MAFKLQGQHHGRIILLKGEENANSFNQEWVGPHGVTARRLNAKGGRVDVINVDEWRDMD